MTTDPTQIIDLMGALPPGTQLHEYAIEKVLGHGGFGITYLARDTHLDKRVAIKEYLPNDLAARAPDQSVSVRSPDSEQPFKWGLENFIKEARVLGKFAHPSLIQVHRYFEANRTAYFVMEFADGLTLAALLKREGTLPEATLRKIIFPLLTGLEEVHRLGVLHRDIKPDNIILREGTLPVLIDFGAARQNLSSMTRSIMSVLTAGYAPIEQYATTGNQGPWTDLYAIGAVAYRAISGKKPPDAVNRIREDPMVPAALAGQGRYTPHFLAAIDWALAVNPEDRPSSISEFKRALDGQLKPPQAGHGSAPPRPGPALEPTVALHSIEPTVALSGRDRPAASAERRRIPLKLLVGSGAGALVLLGLVLALALRQTAPEPVAAPIVTTAPPPAPAQAEPPAASPAEAAAAPQGALTETPAPQAPIAPVAAPEAQAPPKKFKAKPKRIAVAEMTPLAQFQDCPICPAMIPLAAGTFQMGALKDEVPNPWETPQHPVTLGKPFAIARTELTRAHWQACVDAGACPAAAPGPGVSDAAQAPVVNVNWTDAQAYVAWLSKQAGRTYRLPTEAEWEYAVRARTGGARYWGGDRTLQCRYGNGADRSAAKLDPKLQAVECDDGYPQLAPVASFEPNAFGLQDMAGNAWEWTQDCWRDTYKGAPADGSAVEFPSCDRRVIRGGSWRARPNSLRSFGRGNSPASVRAEDLGLRVVAE